MMVNLRFTGDFIATVPTDLPNEITNTYLLIQIPWTFYRGN